MTLLDEQSMDGAMDAHFAKDGHWQELPPARQQPEKSHCVYRALPQALAMSRRHCACAGYRWSSRPGSALRFQAENDLLTCRAAAGRDRLMMAVIQVSR
jgi:hypothetical protein